MGRRRHPERVSDEALERRRVRPGAKHRATAQTVPVTRGASPLTLNGSATKPRKRQPRKARCQARGDRATVSKMQRRRQSPSTGKRRGPGNGDCVRPGAKRKATASQLPKYTRRSIHGVIPTRRRNSSGLAPEHRSRAGSRTSPPNAGTCVPDSCRSELCRRCRLLARARAKRQPRRKVRTRA